MPIALEGDSIVGRIVQVTKRIFGSKVDDMQSILDIGKELFTEVETTSERGRTVYEDIV